MGSAFGSSTTSWGTSYTMPKASTPLASYKKPHKPSGIFGHLEDIAGNLLGDVKDAAVGIPMGLVQLAEHPVRSIEAMGKAEWTTYSPLFHGKVGEFLHGFEEHPLQPILDIATIVTLGGAAAGTLSASTARGLAAAGRVGAAEKFAGFAGKTLKEGKVVPRDPINVILSSKLTKGATGIPDVRVAYRHVSGNPVTRARQNAFAKLADIVAEKAPGSSAAINAGHLELEGAARWMGEGARYKKALGHNEADRRMATHHLQMSILKDAVKLKGLTGVQIWEKLEPHFGGMMDRHEMGISPSQLRKKSDGSGGLAYGYQFRKDPLKGAKKDPYIPKDNSPEEIAKAIDRWKKDEFTNDIAEAKVNADGTYAVARSAEEMAKEASNSYRAIHAIHSKPMMVWKWLVLAASPRFFINNVVGNTLMYVMATNPKASIEGIVHTIVQGKRSAAAQRAALTPLDRMLVKAQGDAIKQGWEHQTSGMAGHEMDELVGDSLEKRAKAVRKLTTTRGRTTAALRGGLYPITHKVSDSWVRRATINYAAKRTSAYQLEFQQLRANGVGYFDAHEAALHKVIDDPGAHHYVTNAVNNVLGDYNYLSRTERAVKNVVPFYTWDRAIMRHTKEMALNRPYEAAMMAGIGTQGVKETQKALGQVPEFLKGAIPVGSHTDGILGFILGVGVGGRTRILTTQGLNPYSTVPDVMSAIGALGGVGKLSAGETVGSQISPFLAGGIEAITGTSLLSGAPIDKAPGGVVGSIGTHVVTSLPQYRLLDSALKGAQPGDDPNKPKLFTSDFRQQLTGYLGLPQKDLSKKSMASIYAREHPEAARRFRVKAAKPAPGVGGSSAFATPGF
jgi:hypothetical protein